MITELQPGMSLTSEAITQMTNTFKGLGVCCTKIRSAGKFIDFFVHDILDYTILSKDGIQFIKNMDVFNLKHSIQEIFEMLEDKIKMKMVKVQTKFVGFDISKKNCVKTD